MLSDLIPNMSRHFLYSVLERNQTSGMEIIETITELQQEQVGEFLYSLGNSLAAYFYKLDANFEGYDKTRIQALTDLKNIHLEADLGEFY